MQQSSANRLLTFLLLLCAWFLPWAAQAGPEAAPRHIIGQTLMVGFRGTTARETASLRRLIRRGWVGGVLLYGGGPGGSQGNVVSRSQLLSLVRSLQAEAPLPLLVAVDHEGGEVNPLGKALDLGEQPSARVLGQVRRADAERQTDTAATAAFARRAAAAMEAVGINVVLGPVLDLDLEPSSPVIGTPGRSYSADPEVVHRHAIDVVQAFRAHRIITVLKHFPGHGSTADDSHLGLADVTLSWTRDELLPYRRLISSQPCCFAVMTGHLYNALLDAREPATLSARTIRGLLRRRLGYNGVVFSDDLGMRSIAAFNSHADTLRKAIAAGVDVLLFSALEPSEIESTLSSIEDLARGRKPYARRIWDAYRRIVKLKAWIIDYPSARVLSDGYARGP